MDNLREFIDNLILGADIHVLEAFAGEGGNPLIRIVVDTPAGITIREVTRIHKQLRDDPDLAQRLDTADYRVEVTSPGTGFGLQEPWQYPRHVGRRLKLRLQRTDGERPPEVVKGALVQVDDGGIRLTMDDGERYIVWEQIDKATVKLAW